MNPYVLELKNISKKYKDGDHDNLVLDTINLHVKQGEFIAIVGPSGSGKSTLLSIAGALLSPTSGTVCIQDNEITNKKQKQSTRIRREQIGFIFQSHQLLPYLNVEEQLKLVSDMNKRNSVKQIHIDEILEDLGLTSSKNKYPKAMSGGEKQRVAIARAFMNDPVVILADEPTASLDGKRGRQVVEMIAREVKKYNKAAIMVTHDERILDLVDVVYHLDNGILK